MFSQLYDVDYVKEALDTGRMGDPTPLRRFIEIYRKEGPEELWKYAKSSMTERELKVIVSERNAKWIPALEDCMSSQACLVAVGALHTVGPDSLLKMLERRGWQITLVESGS